MKKAFTLIELLIVVAIIAILAAIAVPNFLEAQTRAKVARVMSDQRTYATALETYMIDNNSYPLHAPFTGGAVNGVTYTAPAGMNNTVNYNSQLFTSSGATGTNVFTDIPTFGRSSTAAHVIGLTSPVSYLNTYVPDAFSQGPKAWTFAYASGPAGYLVWSPGPDGADQLDQGNAAEIILRSGQSLPSPYLLCGPVGSYGTGAPSVGGATKAYTYDATNGTTGDGDVYRTK